MVPPLLHSSDFFHKTVGGFLRLVSVVGYHQVGNVFWLLDFLKKISFNWENKSDLLSISSHPSHPNVTPVFKAL